MSAPQAMDMGDPSPGDLSHGDLHWQTQPLETQAPWSAFGTHTIDFFTFLYYRRHFGYIQSISVHFFTTGGMGDPSLGDPSLGDLSRGDLHWQTHLLETQASWETRIREAHN